MTASSGRWRKHYSSSISRSAAKPIISRSKSVSALFSISPQRLIISSVIGGLSGSRLAVATQPYPATADDHPSATLRCGTRPLPREVAEMALAHTVENRVEAAYARSDLLERRRELMDQWARFVCPSKV